jgi:hypothetical protein
MEETNRCHCSTRSRAASLRDLAIGQGGRLRDVARHDGVPFLQLPDDPCHPAFVMQPRESVSLQATALLVFLAELRLPAGSNGMRLDRTIDLVMRQRATTFATLTALGDNPFHQALFVTYFNAHMTTYFAALNGFDSLPVPTMGWLKTVIENVPRDPNGRLSFREHTYIRRA